MNRSGIFICSAALLLAGSWLGVAQQSLWPAAAAFSAAVFALGLAVSYKNRKAAVLCIFCCSFCCGWMRGAASFQPSRFAVFENQKVIIDARIVSDIHKARQNMQSFDLLPLSGYSQKISVLTFSRGNYFYGQRVYAIGKLKIPSSSGSFDYKKYLQARGVYAEMFNPEIYVLSAPRAGVVYYSLRAKHFIYDKFFARLPAERAALLVALIIGQKDLMPSGDVSKFNRAGVAHLIAVSGFILTLTLVFTERLKAYIGRMPAMILCLAIAVLYIIMADFASGVFRAAIMAGLYAVSKIYGRQYSVIPSLAFTAALLVLANPLIIKYDIGFMLSFLSILGIVLLAPLLQIALKFMPSKFGIRQIIAVTFAAQVITTPLTLYYFSQFSLVAPITNLMILPVVEICLALGYVLCLPFAGFIAAKAVNAVLAYVLFIVGALAKPQFAAINFSISWQAMCAAYAAMALAYFWIAKFLKPRL
ncbi:ComEC/Rec2 family competence protein [Patescibacteria group bacterium]|nr:ComEC/Rec2 family competence protein [Patescibacteria group bacterium]